MVRGGKTSSGRRKDVKSGDEKLITWSTERLWRAKDKVWRLQSGNTDSERTLFSVPYSLNCPRIARQGLVASAALSWACVRLRVSVSQRRGFPPPSLQIWEVSLNPGPSITLMLHYQPTKRFERKDLWFLRFCSAEFPILHLSGWNRHWGFWRWENKWLHPQVIFF